MGATMSGTKQAAAAEVWRRLAEFAFTNFQAGEHVRILREMGLTPGHMKALAILDPEEPRPMRAMADALACDASLVTWLVDRLEERGLVERRVSPTDRRVKTLVLTPRGISTRERLAEALYKPPADLLLLDLATLDALRNALRELPTVERRFWPGPTAPAEQSEAV